MAEIYGHENSAPTEVEKGSSGKGQKTEVKSESSDHSGSTAILPEPFEVDKDAVAKAAPAARAAAHRVLGQIQRAKNDFRGNE